MENNSVLYSVKDGICDIVWNQPEKLNPMNDATISALTEAFTKASQDDEVRVIIVSGAGRAFSAGGDIGQMLGGTEAADNPGIDLTNVQNLIRLMRNTPKPIIAAIHGPAAGGGCNFALACDMAICAENTKFIEAFVNIGLTPDTAGVYTLPRIIGTSRAFEFMASGRVMRADEALQLGIVNEVVPTEKVMERAHEIAAKYAAGPTKSYAMLKKMINASMFAGMDEFFKTEWSAVNEASKTEDFHEGMKAFVEKRPAKFQGK